MLEGLCEGNCHTNMNLRWLGTQRAQFARSHRWSLLAGRIGSRQVNKFGGGRIWGLRFQKTSQNIHKQFENIRKQFENLARNNSQISKNNSKTSKSNSKTIQKIVWKGLGSHSKSIATKWLTTQPIQKRPEQFDGNLPNIQRPKWKTWKLPFQIMKPQSPAPKS